MKNLLFALSFGMLLAACCPKRCAQKTPPHPNCAMTADPGPCRMAIKRYYYDPVEKRCREFIYGGCAGRAPFETLEACRTGCGCE